MFVQVEAYDSPGLANDLRDGESVVPRAAGGYKDVLAFRYLHHGAEAIAQAMLRCIGATVASC